MLMVPANREASRLSESCKFTRISLRFMVNLSLDSP